MSFYARYPFSSTGTVTTISVNTANGFAGTVTNPTTNPSLTLSTTVTGILKGDGVAISAATPGADYVIPSGSITGTAGNITATSNSTLVTLSSLSLPYSQVTGGPSVNAITALTGDGTATGPGSVPFTLSTVNSNIGTFAALTINAKGLSTAGANLSGDISTSGAVSTLATVNSNVGSFTNANITVNGKGLITAASNGTVNPGTVTTVSIVPANGFAGTVATATSTPAITLTTSASGVLKGSSGSLVAATSGTDYSAGTSALATGILKSTTTTGALTIAVAGDFPTLNQNTTGTAANITATSNSTLTTLSALSLPVGQLTGVLPLANGGTSTNLTAVAGGVHYSTASATGITAAGTTGQVLISNGTAAPTWTTTGNKIYGMFNTSTARAVGTSFATIVYDVVVKDTASAYNSTTGVYTAPRTDYYTITGTFGTNPVAQTANQGTYMFVFINGTQTAHIANYRSQVASAIFNDGAGAVTLALNSGDLVTIRMTADVATTLVASNPTSQFWSIYAG